MRVLELPATIEEISNALDFISNSLKDFSVIDKKTAQDAMLATEESLIKLFEHAKKRTHMTIAVKKSMFGNVVVHLSVPGAPFDFYKDMGWMDPMDIDDYDSDESVEMSLRGVVLTSLEGDIRYENKKDVNNVHVILKKAD